MMRPRALLHPLLQWPWRIYEMAAMVVGLGLLALICLAWTPFALLLNPLLPERHARRTGRAAIHVCFRLYLTLLRWLCFCRFDLTALQALAREPGPRIVVANHPSLLDAVLLVACLPNAVCVMKGSLMRNPLLGAGARMARYIVNDTPLTMIRQAIRTLAEGDASLIIFPEGTRTATPPVGPCAATAGLIAARSGVAVQALIIEMSTPYLGKRWPLWRPPRLPLTCRLRLGRRFDRLPAPQRFGADIEAHFRDELSRPTPFPHD